VSDELMPWDVAPFVELTGDELAAITAIHDLPPMTRRLPSTGVIHTIYVLGEQYVLRVPKRIDEGLSDLHTEVVAAPVARNAGVRTPAMVVFDESQIVIDVPFTVFELVEGTTLGARAFDPRRDEGVYRELGRQLATLHREVTSVDDPRGWLDHDERPSEVESLVHDLVAADRLLAGTARWVLDTFARLQPAVESARQLRRFIHNDVQANNVMVTPDEEAVLIDWGDAAWGDPARDLNDVWPRAVPFVLAGYREVMPMDQDDSVEARVLFDLLEGALRQIGRRHGSRFVELLAELSSESSWARPLLSRP
jgi:hygromycin-B 7''-O-kinase